MEQHQDTSDQLQTVIRAMASICSSETRSNNGANTYICRHSLMKGIKMNIDEAKKKEIIEWKQRAKEIEKQLLLKRRQKFDELRQAAVTIERKLQRQHIDVNQNYHEYREDFDSYNDCIDNTDSKSSYHSADKDDSSSYKSTFTTTPPLSDNQQYTPSMNKSPTIDRSSILSNPSINKSTTIDRSNPKDVEKSFHNIQDQAMLSLSKTPRNLLHFPEITQISSVETRQIDNSSLKVIAERSECSSLDSEKEEVPEFHKSNHSIMNVTEDLVPEVMEHMKSLHVLQEQQSELDDWYENMQKQLEVEKIRLVEKYDELKLKNIKKQQHIIESSQEFLRTASIHATPNQNLSSNIHTPIQTQHFNLGEHLINKIAHTVVTQRDNLNRTSEVAAQKASNNSGRVTPKVKRLLPSPPTEHEISKYANKEASRQKHHSPGNGCDRTVSPKTVYPKEFSPRILHQKDVSPKTLYQNDNTQQKMCYEDDHVKNKESSTVADMLSIDNMAARRKSRPIKFFNTPISETKQSSVKYHDTGSIDRCNNTEESVETRTSTSTSTPQGLHGVIEKNLAHEFSPVFLKAYVSPENASQSNLFADSHPPKVDNFNTVQRYQEEKAAFKITAVAKAFIVRRLMQTNKIQDIVKTIKDTKTFLCDIDKENSGRKTASHADKQLQIRLQDELSTKRKKLYDTFFNMKPADQMKLLTLSRLQKQEKEYHLAYSQSRQKKMTNTDVSKKLSAASQRSMKRRNDKNIRPNTAPEKTSSKKPHQQKEAKPLRPIQSCASPILNERSRLKLSVTTTSPSRSRNIKKSVNKKLNMNSAVITPQTQRTMAAKLSNRHSSAV